MTAYYNEIDPFCAQWLQNLMDAGHIARGDIDTRSIEDVTPNDVRGYTQCHFFAGLGGWAYALNLAGWSDRPVWTGSCPCQPFSVAGKGEGTSDPRHLWPHFYRLIKACRPSVVFGEQVASGGVLGNADESMYAVSSGQTIGSVQAIYGARSSWLEAAMQGVPTSLREEVAKSVSRIQAASEKKTIRGDSKIRKGVPIQESGDLFGFGVPQESSEEGFAIRLGQVHSRITSTDQFWSVRDFRMATGFGSDQKDIASVTVPRQNQSIQRLCVLKCESGVLCDECIFGELGEGFGSGDCSLLGKKGEKIDEQRGITAKNDVGANAHDGEVWIDAVFNDLESADYACAAIAFPASSVGAPHIRDRNYWVADLCSERLAQRISDGRVQRETLGASARQAAVGRSDSGRMADSAPIGHSVRNVASSVTGGRQGSRTSSNRHGFDYRPSPIHGFWEDAEWLLCTDSKWRPVEPGTFPLAHGLPIRMGKLPPQLQRLAEVAGLDAASLKRAKRYRVECLKGYGNAIVPQAAAEFVGAYLDAKQLDQEAA